MFGADDFYYLTVMNSPRNIIKQSLAWTTFNQSNTNRIHSRQSRVKFLPTMDLEVKKILYAHVLASSLNLQNEISLSSWKKTGSLRVAPKVVTQPRFAQALWEGPMTNNF